MSDFDLTGIRKIGAFKDKSDRALRYGPKSSGYTPKKCMEACPEYKYFALQYNGHCFCDNDLERAKKYGRHTCGLSGGAWCNYVYENESAVICYNGAGTGPSTWEGVIKVLINHAKQTNPEPLFRTIPYDGVKHNRWWDDRGTKGQDWTAEQIIPHYCPESSSSPKDISAYCKLGDRVRTNYGTKRTPPFLMAHNSICKRVPTILVANVHPKDAGGRHIRVPDPKKYDMDLYTALGFYMYDEYGYVVLKCVLEAVQQPNPMYIEEWHYTKLYIYKAFETDFANTYLIETRNNPWYPKSYTTDVKYDAAKPATMMLKDPTANNPKPALAALLRMVYAMTGEVPRPPPGTAKLNTRDGLWQGWLVQSSGAGAVRNKLLAHTVMKFLCKHNVAQLAKTEYGVLTKKKGGVLSGWERKTVPVESPIFSKVCACLDQAKDKELKRIDGRMRVECHSAACVGGDDDVYKFTPQLPCTALQVCNQSVNVTANKAMLSNIQLKCTVSAPVTPPNTASASDSLGSRPTPPSMSGGVQTSGTAGTSAAVSKPTTTTTAVANASWDTPTPTSTTVSHQSAPQPAAPAQTPEPPPTPADAPNEQKATHKTVLGVKLPRKVFGVDVTIVLIAVVLIVIAVGAYAIL